MAQAVSHRPVPLRTAFDPWPVRVGFVVDSLTVRNVSFRPHRTSVFPLIVVPPVLHTMLLLTEGRAGELWESSNKQYPVGYRGVLDAEVLSQCSLFPVSACCLLVSSSSLFPFYQCNIPLCACHPYFWFTDTSVLHSPLDTVRTVSCIVWHVSCAFRPRSLHHQPDNIRCPLSERHFWINARVTSC